VNFAAKLAAVCMRDSVVLQVFKDDNTAANSKILGIEVDQEGAADGSLCSSLGPACVLHPESVAALLSMEGRSDGSNSKALGLFLQQLLARGRPLYCIDLPFYFSLTTPDDYTITNAFFKYYHELRATAAREVSWSVNE